MAFFFRGDDVEIASKEEGFKGSYYSGIIISVLPQKHTHTHYYIVQYRTLFKDDSSGFPLRDFVTAAEIRPLPPLSTTTSFRVGDKVDAYHNDGWWAGKVVRKEGERYWVYFKETGDECEYEVEELRVHQDWVNGRWVSGLINKKRNK